MTERIDAHVHLWNRRTDPQDWIDPATMAIGPSGAKNAALFAAAILSGRHPAIRDALLAFRARQTQDVLDHPDPRS